MIQFVQSKPTKKIHHTYQTTGDSRVARAKEHKRKISLKVLRGIFIVCALVYGGFLLFKNTLLDSNYVITKVKYAASSVAIYNDPAVYKAAADYIKKENYHVVKFNQESILTKLQAQYPFITALQITFL